MNAEHCKAYTLLQEQQIDDIHAHGYLLRHNKSGARVLLLETEDDNKVFNIAFRTPPADSTGVAHILEHSVLCGSREFPLKDPFVELVKGSVPAPSAVPDETGQRLRHQPVRLQPSVDQRTAPENHGSPGTERPTEP